MRRNAVTVFQLAVKVFIAMLAISRIFPHLSAPFFMVFLLFGRHEGGSWLSSCRHRTLTPFLFFPSFLLIFQKKKQPFISICQHAAALSVFEGGKVS